MWHALVLGTCIYNKELECFVASNKWRWNWRKIYKKVQARFFFFFFPLIFHHYEVSVIPQSFWKFNTWNKIVFITIRRQIQNSHCLLGSADGSAVSRSWIIPKCSTMLIKYNEARVQFGQTWTQLTWYNEIQHLGWALSVQVGLGLKIKILFEFWCVWVWYLNDIICREK